MSKDTEIMGKMADGTPVRIRKDATHYRAFNAEGQQVGNPYIHLNYLLQYLGITLGEGQDLPAAAQPEKAPSAQKVGEAEIKPYGRYDVTYDGFHYRATCKTETAEHKCFGPYVSLEVLLATMKSDAYVTDVPPAPQADTAAAEGETGKLEGETPAAKGETDKPEGETAAAPSEPAAPGMAAAPPADVTKCGQHEDGVCKMDGENCDGQCGEHAARAKDLTETHKKPEIARKRVK